eukprot:scaffold2899_cov85-Skeletonema_dohrnii-CCMP3373.AAC.4
MGRKRNQGKARKAAKARAKAREELFNNNPVTNERQQLLAEQMQQLENGNSNFLSTSGSDTTKCYHGCKEMDNMCIDFVSAFGDAVYEADKRGESTSQSLVEAKNATMDEFADVWNDSAKMEIVLSYYLSHGTESILEGNYGYARECSVFARYMEQWTAVYLDMTHAIMNWSKVEAMSIGDIHTCVKFFRRRIPCSCLDEKYDEVKNITKMGICYNPECKFYQMPERRNTMYCSGCRCVTYCSRECQKASWTTHKEECDGCVARIAKFEAKKQS